jgi:hypothetical protein
MRSPAGSPQRPWVRRIGWFIVIWALSVIALGIAATLLRALMQFAGLKA